MMTRQAELLYALLFDRLGDLVTFEEISAHIQTKSEHPRLLIWWLIYNIRDHMPAGQEIKCKYGVGYKLVSRETSLVAPAA